MDDETDEDEDGGDDEDDDDAGLEMKAENLTLVSKTDLTDFFEAARKRFTLVQILAVGQDFHDWQKEAVSYFVTRKHCVVNRGVGEGKTMVALLILEWLKTERSGQMMLVVAPTRILMQQHFETFEKAGFTATWYDSHRGDVAVMEVATSTSVAAA